MKEGIVRRKRGVFERKVFPTLALFHSGHVRDLDVHVKTTWWLYMRKSRPGPFIIKISITMVIIVLFCHGNWIINIMGEGNLQTVQRPGACGSVFHLFKPFYLLFYSSPEKSRLMILDSLWPRLTLQIAWGLQNTVDFSPPKSCNTCYIHIIFRVQILL